MNKYGLTTKLSPSNPTPLWKNSTTMTTQGESSCSRHRVVIRKQWNCIDLQTGDDTDDKIGQFFLGPVR